MTLDLVLHDLYLYSCCCYGVSGDGIYSRPLASALTALAILEGSAETEPHIEIRAIQDLIPIWQNRVLVFVNGEPLDLAPETGSKIHVEFTSKIPYLNQVPIPIATLTSSNHT